MSLFCETPSSWGGCQNTCCSTFAKGPRLLNIVMTFVLHPLSHYNSITEPRTRFLLSLLEDLTIDFPSHFILSLIDVYRDTTTHDKLIFPSAITWIIRHFSVSYPELDHFFFMCAIDAATVWRSKAQLQPKWPQTETATPPAFSAPSTSAPSSSTDGVTLEAILAQLQHMDAHLDTLSDELCQVNTRVNRIAPQQAHLGGFVESPSLEASEDEDDGASSSSDEEMIASQWLALCHSWQKGGVILGMRVVMHLGGELTKNLFVRGSIYTFFRDVVRTYASFLFFIF